MYKHYIRVNEKNEVIAAFSTAFQDPVVGDVELVADTEERHFNLTLQSDLGVYKYTYDPATNTIHERTEEELEEIEEPIRNKMEIENEIVVQKKILADTDWIIDKISEYEILGSDTSPLLSKYAVQLESRANAREEINRLEMQI